MIDFTLQRFIAWPQPQPKLETKRLFLRSLTLSDAKQIQILAGDFAIADTTLNVPYPYSDGLAQDWISTHLSHYQQEQSVTFGISLKEPLTLIGVVGLGIKKPFHRGELGYWIAKAHWNNGFATEAARAAVDFGFRQLGLHKIEAVHLERNPTSGKVLTKLGFGKEGVLRDHLIKWDRFENVVAYGRIAERSGLSSATQPQ